MKKLLVLLLLSTSLSTFARVPPSSLDFTLSDFCYQQPNVQIRGYGGYVLYFPNKEVGITDESVCVYKDAYGQIESKGKLKNGLYVGKWTSWYKNGQRKYEGNWKDGEVDGKHTAWYENGQKKEEWHYKNGIKDGKLTWWSKYGAITVEAIYKDDECISGDC